LTLQTFSVLLVLVEARVEAEIVQKADPALL
jgi:hypothetical protein